MCKEKYTLCLRFKTIFRSRVTWVSNVTFGLVELLYNALIVLLYSQGDSTFVPVRAAGETTDSDDAAPRAVRFNKVAEVNKPPF